MGNIYPYPLKLKTRCFCQSKKIGYTSGVSEISKIGVSGNIRAAADHGVDESICTEQVPNFILYWGTFIENLAKSVRQFGFVMRTRIATIRTENLPNIILVL